MREEVRRCYRPPLGVGVGEVVVVCLVPPLLVERGGEENIYRVLLAASSLSTTVDTYCGYRYSNCNRDSHNVTIEQPKQNLIPS